MNLAHPPEIRHAATAALAAAAVATLIVLAFLWPIRAATPGGIPLAVAGPPQAVAPLTAGLTQGEAPFVVTPVGSRDDAVARLKDRTAYGAIVVTPGPTTRVEVLTATAASPVVAQALAQQASALSRQAPPGRPLSVMVTEVVPTSAADPRGMGIGAAALPLGLGGLAGGAAIALLVTTRRSRLVATGTYAVAAGGAIAAVLGPWFGWLTGSFPAEWAIASLAVGATATLIGGLHAWLSRAGLALGGAITALLGNPLSGQQLPPEFLPGPWGAIGQLLVPGAAGTALRLESYFPQAPLTAPLLALSAWLLFGLILMASKADGREANGAATPSRESGSAVDSGPRSADAPDRPGPRQDLSVTAGPPVG